MSIRTYLLVLLFIFNLNSKAQQSLEGYYDPEHKQFYAKVNLLNRFDEPYEISTFKDGFAEIKMLYTSADRKAEIENSKNGVLEIKERKTYRVD